jgi:predicted nucleic acid-binding protein
MADVLLDTTVFIDVYIGNLRATRLIEQFEQSTRRMLYSSITVFELWLRPMTRTEESQHLLLLRTCDEAPFGGRAARIMASWFSGHPRSGRRRLLGDAMIAATAASLGATIFMRNPRDFTRFHTDVQGY